MVLVTAEISYFLVTNIGFAWNNWLIGRLIWQIQEKAESPNEPFILLSVFGQPSGSGSGPFDDIIEDVISRFPQRSKVTKFKPHSYTSSNQKRNFFAESIDKIDDAVDAVGSDAGNGTQNGKTDFCYRHFF